MSLTIELKNSNVSGRVPTISDLSWGELAINIADGKLFYKKYDPENQAGTIDSFDAVSLGTITGTLNLSTQTTGVLPVEKGGTGASTRQDSINALVGSTSAGTYLRGNGSAVLMSPLLAADITGTLTPLKGGTGITDPGATGNVLTSNGAGQWISAPVFVPASVLVEELEGEITDLQLASTLSSRINLIDAPITGLVTKVVDLETVFGDTTSAAASAATAALSAAQAVSSEAAAILAESGAKIAEASAVQASSEALQVKVDTFFAKNAAETARDESVLAKADAETAASSAKVSENSAALSATNAEGSASSASNSATTAANSAGNAGSSASAAANSESNALTYATNAETASSASINAKVAAESARDEGLAAASAAASSAFTATTKATEAGQYASSASISATNAATSAGNASTSATQASNSATNAEGSASSASNNATAAANSAGDAGNSATAAANSESNALTYATNAETASSASINAKVAAETARDNATLAASAAASSAFTATTKATEASESANSASILATNAATSAGNASTSATQASNSATNAEGSASSASNNATAAANSAGAAGSSATAAASSASIATTKADEAGISAQAASTSENNASISADNAFNSASSASASAIAAATASKDAAGNALSSASALQKIQSVISGVVFGLPLDQWNLNGQTIVNVTDYRTGLTALRLTNASGAYPNQGTYVPINYNKKYRVKFWAKPSSDTDGKLYFSLRQFKNIPWIVQGAVYENKQVGLTNSSNTGLHFSPDGLNMYTCGSSADTVDQYLLSAPWDISSISGSASQTKSVASQEGTPQGLVLSKDGTRLYLVGSANDRVYQYNLSTAWDISTMVYSGKYLSVGSSYQGETIPTSVFISSEGTKLYITGSLLDSIFEYDLTTPFELDTATYNNVSLNLVSAGTGELVPTGIAISPDGKNLYVVGSFSDSVHHFILKTPWELSTATYTSSSKLVSSETLSPQDVRFSEDGTKMYVASTTIVYQYYLNVPCATNNGRSPYKPSGTTRDSHVATYGDTWGEYNYLWTDSNWQTDAAYVLPEFLNNYAGTAGYWDVQGFSFVDVTDTEQVSAAVETLATTTAGPDGTTAQYTVKVDANGHVAGFGLSSTNNNSTPTSAFIIRADKFAVIDPSSTADNLTNNPSAGNVPFIIENGQTFIKSAVIPTLTADKIDTRNLTIKDAAGQVILSATDSLDYNRVGGTKPPADADKTSSNIAAGIANQGALATKSIVASAELAAGLGVNSVPNSDFAVNTASWYISWIQNGVPSETELILNPVSTYKPLNKNVIGLYITGTTGNSIVDFASAFIAVEPGKRYEISCYLGSLRCDADVFVVWFNTDNVNFSETHFAPATRKAGGTNLSDFSRPGGFVTAPATASYADVRVRAYPRDAGQTTSRVFATNFYFGEALPNQTELSPWTPGPLTAVNQLGFVGDLDADKTSNNVAAGIANQGALATKNSLDYFELNTVFDTFFTNLNKWEGIGNNSNLISDSSVSGGTFLRVTGYKEILSKDYIPVDTNRIYYSKCRARRASGTTGTFYAGFACYDKDKNYIAPNPPGSTYNYSAFSAENLTSNWTTKGNYIDQPMAPDAGALHFRPGTAFVKLMMLCNYQGSNNDVTDIDFLEFYDVTESYFQLQNDFINDGQFLITGNSIKRISGDPAWNAHVYSRQGFLSGAYVSFRADQLNSYLMVGLNSDPTSNNSYETLDYAWYIEANNLHIYENGTDIGDFGNFSTSDILSIEYDGISVKYFQNGVLKRNINVDINVPLYFDSSFYSLYSSISRVNFGPLTSNKKAKSAEDLATTANSNANTAIGSLANKLNKAGDQITGRVTMGVADGIFAGTDLNNGVYFGNNGLVGKKNGNTTFAVSTTGDATFAGTLSADSIQANSITVSKLLIKSNSGSMLPDPKLLDLTAWNITGTYTYRDMSPAFDLGSNPKVLQVDHPNVDVKVEIKEFLSITNTRTYDVRAGLKGIAGSNRPALVYINFYDSNFTKLTTSWGNATYSGIVSEEVPAGLGIQNYGKIIGVSGYDIPSDAVYCKIGVVLRRSTGTDTSFAHILNGFVFEEQIDTNKLATSSVNTLNIAGSAVTSTSASYINTTINDYPVTSDGSYQSFDIVSCNHNVSSSSSTLLVIIAFHKLAPANAAPTTGGIWNRIYASSTGVGTSINVKLELLVDSTVVQTIWDKTNDHANIGNNASAPLQYLSYLVSGISAGTKTFKLRVSSVRTSGTYGNRLWTVFTERSMIVQEIKR